MTVTFFGHGDTPEEIQPILEKTLVYLIEKKDAVKFYVGNHGNFDKMARKTLQKLKEKHAYINYAVVLSNLPSCKERYKSFDFSETVFPDGFENTYPKYAIIKRNKWMIDHSDAVVTYVVRGVGGAAKFKAMAEKRGLYVINLVLEDRIKN